MIAISNRTLNVSLAAVMTCISLAASGCSVPYPGRSAENVVPVLSPTVPRELFKTTIPDYIIEPPDVLAIEAIGLVPKSPYRLKPLDAVSIMGSGLGEDVILQGEFTIQPSGVIQLGNELGYIDAAGKSIKQLHDELLERLKRTFNEPKVSMTLTQIAAQQQIVGEHLVAPDGSVNLGTYGRVRVVGMTIEQATRAVELQLGASLEAPAVSLDVVGFNSKVFYVVTQGAGLGDAVAIFPIKGNETVLDAVGQIQGLQSHSSTRMWVARPGPNDSGGDQILPVDWLAISQRGDVTTNYQLLPGDRLFVSEDKLVALDTALAKAIAPMERILGVTLLGTTAAQQLAFFEEQGSRGGF